MIKNVVDLEIIFIVLYFKKLILNSPYNYQKSAPLQNLLYRELQDSLIKSNITLFS